MRTRALVFAVLAIILAVGTALFIRGRLSDARQQMAVSAVDPQSAKVFVLVAANDVGSGDLVREQDLRWQAWPDSGAGDFYLLKDRDDMRAVVGGVVSHHLAKGEPVIMGQIIKPGDRGFLAAVLGPGSRAVTVPLTVTSGVGGLVIPGDHVDLILSHPITDERAPNAPARLVGETVLSDIRVVAIDQTFNDQDKKAVVGKSATLEVSPKQAEIVEVAKQLGNLSLSLRSVGYGVPEPGTAVTHTWDSDVSPLIRHNRTDVAAKMAVTILRGDVSRAPDAPRAAGQAAAK